MLKGYLGTQPPSLRAFMIRNTPIYAQKPLGRQLNTRVCGSESAHSFLHFRSIKNCLSTSTKTIHTLVRSAPDPVSS